MNKMLIAAAASGSGKTIVTCAILAALQKRGLRMSAFKCGPDYIDPMFHRAVFGVESHNLDLFLSDAETVQSLFQTYNRERDVAICEGVMGYYDGLGGKTDRGSGWQLAEVLELPVLFVVRPEGNSLTLAAQLRGICAFRSPHHIKGILLNHCTESRYRSLAPLLEQETGLPVLGYLPPMQEAVLESRHLGLYTTGEIQDLAERMEHLGEQLEKSVDIERLLQLTSFPETPVSQKREKKEGTSSLRLAVAQDQAFCFLYAETIDVLRDAGIEPIYFSPLREKALPQGVDGLYLPGGYPEIYAAELSKNEEMRTSIRTAIQAGLPTVAECGGLLYLCRTLEDTDGKAWEMADILPTCGKKTEGLVRFGYARLTAQEDSLLFRKGESVPVHAFHYWDTEEKGDAFAAQKPTGKVGWRCGFANETLYAAFPHLYFAGEQKLVQRWEDAMRSRKTRKEE